MDEMASEGAREAKTKTDPVASVFELPALALGASDFATKKISVVEGGDEALTVPEASSPRMRKKASQ